MAIFLVLTDAEYDAMVVVLGGWKEGIRRVGTNTDRPDLMDAELKLVSSIEEKMKNAG